MPVVLIFLAVSLSAAERPAAFPDIPASYLEQAEHIPEFWVNTVEDVNRFLDEHVRKGSVQQIGVSAGGRPIRAVFYGTPREGKGTTTFSGSLGFGDTRAYRGSGHERTVYLGLAGVHGGEFEGIAGMVNLISVIETGKDLRGREWPEITAAAASLGRLILVPVVNVDGRSRVPLRMEKYRGSDETVHEYFNTGGRLDGKIIDWPQCKEFIPLDFSRTQFPGGYPNDAGVNVQHDDFLGKRQPETQALFDLVARERPDLVLNMHTGAVFPLVLRPFAEPVLTPVFENLFRRVQGRLAVEDYQATIDPEREGAASRMKRLSSYNLDTALNLHCGALSVVIESPSHGFSTAKRDGKPVIFTVDDLVSVQLFCHLEAMRFLGDTGGRARWLPAKRRP
ncbi:MAG: M14 family zinc carboxypeptidase [Bryobacteraceae bacterium]